MKEYFPALAYPFRDRGYVTSMIAVIILFIPVITSYALMLGKVANVIIYGYLFCFFMKMVLESSNGNDTICDFPPFESYMESMVLPFFRVTVLTLICFFPGTLSDNLEWKESTTWMLYIAGFLYFPLAFMRVSIMESITAISPIQIFRTFLKIPIPCILLSLFSAMVMVISTLASETSILINIVLVPVHFYMFSVLMNIMGRFFRNYEDAFDF